MMTPKQRRDWLETLRYRHPDFATVKSFRLLDRLDAADPSGRWQLGLCAGAGLTKVAARWHGEGSAWRAPLSKALGRRCPPPRPGLPRVELTFDFDEDRCVRARFFSKDAVQTLPFSPEPFSGSPVGPLLNGLHALHPVAGIVADKAGTFFSLRLSKPVPWPLLLRLDLARPLIKSFEGTALAGARGVGDLAVEGSELWAFFGD